MKNKTEIQPRTRSVPRAPSCSSPPSSLGAVPWRPLKIAVVIQGNTLCSVSGDAVQTSFKNRTPIRSLPHCLSLPTSPRILPKGPENHTWGFSPRFVSFQILCSVSTLKNPFSIDLKNHTYPRCYRKHQKVVSPSRNTDFSLFYLSPSSLSIFF